MCVSIFIAVLSFLIEILQWKVLHLNYTNSMITCGFTSLDSGKPCWCIRMAENNNDFGSGSKIKPYQFKPVHTMGLVTVKIRVLSQKPQVSFIGRLGTTDWYECTKCVPMPGGIKFQCCQETKGLQECLTGDKNFTVSWATGSLKWLV